MERNQAELLVLSYTALTRESPMFEAVVGKVMAGHCVWHAHHLVLQELGRTTKCWCADCAKGG